MLKFRKGRHTSISCCSSTDKHNDMLEMPIMKPGQTKVRPILPVRKKTKAECVSGVLCLHCFSGEKKSTFHLFPPNWLHQDSPCTALSFLPFIIPPVKDMLSDIADSSEVSRIRSLKTQTFCVLLCLQVWICSRVKKSTCCELQLAADNLGFIDNELSVAVVAPCDLSVDESLHSTNNNYLLVMSLDRRVF